MSLLPGSTPMLDHQQLMYLLNKEDYAGALRLSFLFESNCAKEIVKLQTQLDNLKAKQQLYKDFISTLTGSN